MNTCTRPGCTRPYRARGLCAVHYHVQRTAGMLRSEWTPAAPVTRYVRTLRRRGWSIHAIARATGVSSTAISMIARGARRRVQQRVADAITGLDPKATPPPARSRDAA